MKDSLEYNFKVTHMELHENHTWLTQLVGEWRCEMESDCVAGQPPQNFTGREMVRTLGGL